MQGVRRAHRRPSRGRAAPACRRQVWNKRPTPAWMQVVEPRLERVAERSPRRSANSAEPMDLFRASFTTFRPVCHRPKRQHWSFRRRPESSGFDSVFRATTGRHYGKYFLLVFTETPEFGGFDFLDSGLRRNDDGYVLLVFTETPGCSGLNFWIPIRLPQPRYSPNPHSRQPCNSGKYRPSLIRSAPSWRIRAPYFSSCCR